jgi:hypothetical protein
MHSRGGNDFSSNRVRLQLERLRAKWTDSSGQRRSGRSHQKEERHFTSSSIVSDSSNSPSYRHTLNFSADRFLREQLRSSLVPRGARCECPLNALSDPAHLEKVPAAVKARVATN